MPDLSLREKLEAVIRKGQEAETALSQLELLSVAEGAEATIADLRAAVAVAEGEKDFVTAGILKEKWIQLLKRGAR